MTTKDVDRPESQRVCRYWVELRNLRDGSVRNLPLRVMRFVRFGGKRGDPRKPDEQVLRLQDDATVIEAKDIEDLAAQLRSKYPDATHERRLHWERDLEAEQRYADALQSLAERVAEAAVHDIRLDDRTHRVRGRGRQ